MAAPIDAGSIYSDVRIRLDRLNKDLKAVSTGFDKMGKKIRTSSDKTEKTMTKNFKSIGLAGTAAIGIITLAFKKSLSVFAQTEQSLANVKAVSNATAAEFRELEDAAAAAGTTTRFTAGQAAEALFFLSSAGLDAKESVAALDGVLTLAGATGSDLANTARVVTSTLSQFDLASKDSAKVANIFAAANSNSQATLEKLQGALRQVGPVAAGLSIGLEETVGSLQALFNAGFQGENAGRALKSALADLANETSPTVQKLNELGVSFESVNPEAVGLTAAIGALEDAGLSTGEVIDAFGKVAGPQLVTLIKAGEEELRNYTSAVTGTNEAARQYAVQNDTLAGSFDALKSAGEGASNSFVGTLSPVLRGIADTIATILRVSAKLPDVLKGLGTGAGVAAVGFIALSKGLALVGISLTGPLGLIAGVGALIVGLVTLKGVVDDVRQAKLSEEFGKLGLELGITGQALDEFTEKAGKVEAAFRIAATDLPATFERTKDLVKEMSAELGISEDRVIDIALSAEKVTDAYKDQLKELKRITTEEQIRNEFSNKNSIAQQNILNRKLAQIEVAREEARIQAEAAEKEKEAQEDLERREAIKQRLITLDELALRGAISESEALEEKKTLREEEIELLLDQALTSGVVSDQVVSDIKKQEDAIDNYTKRLDELADDTSDALEKSADKQKELSQKFNAALIKDIIDHKKAIQEQVKNQEKAAQDMIFSYIDIFETAGEVVTELLSKNAEDAIDQVGELLIQLGAKMGNAYVAAAGLALQFTQDLIQTLNVEGLELKDALFAIFVPFGPQIKQATKEAKEKLDAQIIQLDNDLQAILLTQRKAALDKQFAQDKKQIEDNLDNRLKIIEDSLDDEQTATLKALGVLEESREDYYDNIADKAISTLEKQLEEEVQLNAENLETLLGQTLENIDLELLAQKELLGELSEEEQAFVDFKQQLSEEEDERERADTIQRIQDLRQDGEDAEADLLQLKIDNQDKLDILADDAAKAEKERIDEIAALEKEAADEKAAAKEAELATLTLNSQAEIDAINNVFNAQETAETKRIELEQANNKLIAQFEYDKAVFDRQLAISQAETNKIVAVSSVPWFESGIFGNTDDKVAEMYDAIIAQLKASPLPSLPALQTGGIVLPQSGGTTAILAENGSPELALNAGESGQALLGQFAQQIVDKMGGSAGNPIIIQNIINGQMISEMVADDINDGKVEIDLS